MGIGSASGKDKAELAAKAAISSPLLETSIDGAHGILVSITASPDIGLEDIDTASAMITGEAHPDANIIWGVAFDPSLEDEMRVTIIATGFEKKDVPEANKTARAAASFAAKKAVSSPESVKTAKQPVMEVEEEEEAHPADEVLSDNEFDEIMRMIQGSKRREAQTPSANNPMNRYGKRF